jgi:hypothetical protein
MNQSNPFANTGTVSMKTLFVSLTLAFLAQGAVAQERLSRETVTPNAPATQSVFQPNATITEGFDSLTATLAAGWFSRNNSELANTAAPFNQGWVQGVGGNFVPAAGQAGGANSFAMASFATVGNGTTGRGQASNWLVSPVVQYGPGASLEFWTIKRDAPFDDSIEVRFSTTTAAANVGTTTASVGDFTNLAFTVNSTILAPPVAFVCPATGVTAVAGAAANTVGYPTAVWCRIVITGFPATGSGRIAFRHNTPDTGNQGVNGTVLGVDTFSFVEGTVVGAATVTGPAQNTAATPILLNRTLPANTSIGNLAFNVTGGPGALNCVTTSAGYSVSPSPLNLVVGTAGNLAVTHTGTTAGTFAGSVTCTPVAPAAGGPFTYFFSTTVAAAAPIVAVPSLNIVGMLALLAGLGLFGAFAVRRFS